MHTFSTFVSGCRRAGAPATVLALLALAAPPAHAAVVHYGNVSASSGTIQVPGPPNSGLFNGPAPSLVSTSSIESSSSAQGYASSNASAENAAIQAYANATANATLNGWGMNNAASASSTYAEFRDLFELHSASFANGTQVRMIFGVLVDGAVSGTGAGESRDGPPDSYISN